MKMQEQVSLAPYTTLRVGGKAQFFSTVQTEDDLESTLRFARARLLPVFVLGGGSNLFVSDEGFPGVVIRMAMTGIRQEGDLVVAGAGVVWESLVEYAVQNQLAGIECLAGIPGTVGATPVQNVGAYGQEVSEVITRVRALHRETGDTLWLSNTECHFGYRTSLFNTDAKNEWILTEVEFRLRPGGSAALKYAELAHHFEGQPVPSLREVSEAVRRIRSTKGMVTARPSAEGLYPAEIDSDTRSAGSFFRNPVVSMDVLERIALGHGEVPHWNAGYGKVKLPAAWLIEHAGVARGFAIGQAGVSSRHTLALVNLGGATAAEMEALRDEVAARVAREFGIQLEQEPVSVPHDPLQLAALLV